MADSPHLPDRVVRSGRGRPTRRRCRRTRRRWWTPTSTPATVGQIFWQAWRPGGVYGWSHNLTGPQALVRINPVTGAFAVVASGPLHAVPLDAALDYLP